jgi:hypothetical protein
MSKNPELDLRPVQQYMYYVSQIDGVQRENLTSPDWTDVPHARGGC